MCQLQATNKYFHAYINFLATKYKLLLLLLLLLYFVIKLIVKFNQICVHKIINYYLI